MAKQSTIAALRAELAESQAELARAAKEIELLSGGADVLLNSIADGVVVVDPQGNIIAGNNAAMRLYGYPPDATALTHMHELFDEIDVLTIGGQPVMPDERPIARALQGESFAGQTYRVGSRDLSRTWIAEISGAPVRNEDGQTLCALITVRDVTEQHHAAEVLEQRVAERTASLQIVHEIDKSILANREPAGIAKAAVDRVMQVTGALRVTVGVVDPDTESVEVLAVAGSASAYIPPGSRWPFSSVWGIDQTQAGQIVTVNDLNELPDSDPRKGPRVGQGMRSFTIIPMIVGGDVIGALTIGRAEKGSLPVDYLDLATHVADSVAIAIRNSRLNQQLVEREAALSKANERLRMLHEIDKAVLATLSNEEIAGATLEHIQQIWGCERASILLYDYHKGQALVLATCEADARGLAAGQTLPLEMLRIPPEHSQGHGHLVQDLAVEHQGESLAEALLAQGIRSHLSVPLISEGHLIGSLNLSSHEPGTFDEETMEAILPVGASLAVALQNARMYQDVKTHQAELQALTRRLLSVQEAERRKLARDLHDGAAQVVTALSLGISSLARHPECSPGVVHRLQEFQSMVSELMMELLELITTLRPAILDRAGLVTAISQYAASLRERSGVEAEVVAEGLDGERLPSEIETALYRLVQEALTNVVRHAKASQVMVRLERRGEAVTAIIEDDGEGFDVDEAAQSGRLGMVGMRERAEMIGGRVTFDSEPGRGTRVAVTAPVRNY